MHEATFRWPRTNAKQVILSGDFDKWSKSIYMTKDATGFQAKVKILWGTKVQYKFIVDGLWQTCENAPTESDPSGRYVNNVYTAPAKPVSPLIESTTKDAPAVKDDSTNIPASETNTPAALSTHKPVNVQSSEDTSLSTSPPVVDIPREPAVPEEVSAPKLAAPQVPAKAAAAPTEDKPTSNDVNLAASETNTPAALSTNKPVNVQSSEVSKDTSLSTPPLVVEEPAVTEAVPEEVSVPEVPAPAASQVPTKPSDTAATVPTEDKPTLNGVNSNHSPQTSLSAARASLLHTKENPPFPTPSQDSTLSKRTGRSFSGTSSFREKRGSIFGGSRASDDGTVSSDGGVRKKKRSIFSKIKHMFDHHDDKDKEILHKK
jgi:hypothetical protein